MAGFKSKNGELLRSGIDFVFGFENKRGEILDHWITFIDAFALPPQEFYDAIEKELTDRKVPGLRVNREAFGEGGILSERRTYLRLFRERLALYTCASPFGSGYFFSCRTVYVPALVRLWHIVAALAFFGIVGGVLISLLGFVFAIIALVALLFALAATFRNASAAAISDMDALLLRIPVVSTLYENWFREDTYFRNDARLIYLQRIPALIREMAEEITAAKGAKLVSSYEHAPVMGEMYRRRAVGPKPEKA